MKLSFRGWFWDGVFLKGSQLIKQKFEEILTRGKLKRFCKAFIWQDALACVKKDKFVVVYPDQTFTRKVKLLRWLKK